MKHFVVLLVRFALFALICFLFYRTSEAQLSGVANLIVIVGGVLLTYPLVLIGRRILDRHHAEEHAVWTTTFVHCGMACTFGVPIVRALVTHDEWRFWILPVSPGVGYALVCVTGAACAVVVLTLALRGFGAPAIVLSRKLAVDWLYAWTRNPMVLASFAFALSIGVWFQSVLFVIWVLVVLAPALLFFVKVFEERELEFRFGQSYLDYRSRTPILFPRKPSRPVLGRGHT